MGHLHVVKPGLLSSVQDAGRHSRALGLPAGGAADQTALRLANALVGNPAHAAALEITLLGPTLHFGTGAVVSLCGAPFAATLDGQPVGLWRPLSVQAGQTLAVGAAARGVRAVLAVRGGLDAQTVFGSASTDLRGGFGGHQGRALRAGDRLTWAAAEGQPLSPRLSGAFVSPALHTPTGPDHRLRVIPTAEATPALLDALCAAPTDSAPTNSAPLTVSPQADRMGVRLSAGVPTPAEPNRVSLPNVPGQVQLPPDGRPILLLPDAGTHGGYPAPLVVIRADLPRLAQLRPGDRVHFQVVDPAQAVAALRVQEQGLRRAESALRLAWSGSSVGMGKRQW